MCFLLRHNNLDFKAWPTVVDPALWEGRHSNAYGTLVLSTLVKALRRRRKPAKRPILAQFQAHGQAGTPRQPPPEVSRIQPDDDRSNDRKTYDHRNPHVRGGLRGLASSPFLPCLTLGRPEGWMGGGGAPTRSAPRPAPAAPAAGPPLRSRPARRRCCAARPQAGAAGPRLRAVGPGVCALLVR